MPTRLAPVITNATFVDSRGYLTRVASGWLQESYVRQGGESSATNTELAGGVLGNSAHIGRVEDDLAQTSTSLAQLEAEVTALQEVVLQQGTDLEALTERVTTLETDLDALTTRVETLETTVADQGTRIQALEAWKNSMQAALPAAVSVTALPPLTDAPATADALRDNLTSAWEGVLETNDAGLATAVNAVRAALAA